MPYSFFYIEANCFCLIVFAFILFKDVRGVDRQEWHHYFDRVLVLQMLYFFFDSLWILFKEDILPFGSVFDNAIDAVLFILASLTAFSWYVYSEVLHGRAVYGMRGMMLRGIPAFCSCALALAGFVMHVGYMTPEGLRPQMHVSVFYALMIALPFCYVIITAVNGVRYALRKESFMDRPQHLIIGFYPFIVLLSTILQIIWLMLPILCYGCTIAMLFVYINSLDGLISQDPLTGLNNRNELKRFLLNSQHLSSAERQTYILMVDVNKFKMINDQYGHPEGDRALCRVADTLKLACNATGARHFIARYGGDEFIVVARSASEEEIRALCESVHSLLAERNATAQCRYDLGVSIGYARLGNGIDAIRTCIAEADAALYKQKKARTSAAAEGKSAT